MARPPLSAMSYSDIIERHKLAPALPKVEGGAVGLVVDAPTIASDGFLLIFISHAFFLANVFRHISKSRLARRLFLAQGFCCGSPPTPLFSNHPSYQLLFATEGWQSLARHRTASREGRSNGKDKQKRPLVQIC
jgi:hypothetical protein